MGVLHTLVGASYAIHLDMKGHIGGVMSHGLGIIHTQSSRQKLNTKSSSELEVVGVSDYVPYPIWVELFLGDQGYDLQENIVYEDNQSLMKLEKNGRKLCRQKSQHTHIRFFLLSM